MLGVLALVAAAFLAGVLVGSAQAAAPDQGAARPLSPATSRPLLDPGLSAARQRPVTASAPPQELTGLPACTLADEPVLGDPWKAFGSVVLDTATTLGPRAVPRDLVDTSEAGLNGGHQVRAIVIDDLRALDRAARRAGISLAIQSAYRSYAEQASTFAYWVAIAGRREALARSARPGHSEHQLGTAIDFVAARGFAPWHRADWAMTDAGAWLMHNAWRYGFVMSYPRGAKAQTCYAYEPWHYRYIGRDLAIAVHHAGVPLRVWLSR